MRTIIKKIQCTSNFLQGVLIKGNWSFLVFLGTTFIQYALIWLKWISSKTLTNEFQKQPPRVVLRKRCFENMQQIYRRTPMPKFFSCEVKFYEMIYKINVYKTVCGISWCFFDHVLLIILLWGTIFGTVKSPKI